ncbi:hypothetical protein PPACK8108_LOCUS6905 [Phakopsora pachyrhizi]|uniref:Uncharacterized protein n=1 Tax=Phakopsora pachyrhizi TaxID=170000 RepID=A0AAV0ARV4_PHAPC|nr:hypothetical protein PPACK8108_LOCUS6905 [Phakopsora pachyrhizi]
MSKIHIRARETTTTMVRNQSINHINNQTAESDSIMVLEGELVPTALHQWMRNKDKSRDDKVIPLATYKRCWFRCRQKNVGRSELNSKDQKFWKIFETKCSDGGGHGDKWDRPIDRYSVSFLLRSMEEDWELEQKTLENEDDNEVMEDIREAAKPIDLRRGSNSHGHQEDRGDWPMASDEDLRLKSDKRIKPRMEQREILTNQRKVTIGMINCRSDKDHEAGKTEASERSKDSGDYRVLSSGLAKVEFRRCYSHRKVLCTAGQIDWESQALEYGWWFVEVSLPAYRGMSMVDSGRRWIQA